MIHLNKLTPVSLKKFFLKIFIIYLFDRERSQVGREAGRERERERQEEAGSLLSREPNVGLDPRTLGS